jgi:hypothetical protein
VEPGSTATASAARQSGLLTASWEDSGARLDADETLIRTLIKGEPITAPTGRADDFSWPHGKGNAEPSAVELAAPEIAVPDADTRYRPCSNVSVVTVNRP